MKPSLLVVDDEPVARQSLSDILKLEGYSVTAVENGQQAVEHVRLHHVDLMIVDLRMPGMTGLEVIQIVNQISPDTEIVLLTAYGSTESAVEALRLRIHDYLLKPASPVQILTSVQRGLSRRDAKLRAKSGNLDDDTLAEELPIYEMKDGTRVDLARRTLQRKSIEVHLTPAEGRLLRIFLENPGKVFSHRELVLLVQGYETALHEAPEILRPLVSRLRQKLSDFPLLGEGIASIRGTGYLYEEKSRK